MCLNKKGKIFFSTLIGLKKKFTDIKRVYEFIGVIEKIQGNFIFVNQDSKNFIFNIDLIASLEILN